MTIYYAGIGAQNTPNEVCDQMKSVATLLATMGAVLRSGAALGADSACEMGAKSINPKLVEIFIALNAERNPEWFNHARKYHPSWSHLTRPTQQLHARNSAIMLGRDLQTPVKFVMCWTPDAEIMGGTGQALRIAEDYSIPVFNLFDPTAIGRLWQFVAALR